MGGNRVFEQVHSYSSLFTLFGSEQAVRQARMAVGKTHYKLHDYETAALLTLCPADVKEAVALIPSLQQPDESGQTRFTSEEELQQLLDELNSYQS